MGIVIHIYVRYTEKTLISPTRGCPSVEMIEGPCGNIHIRSTSDGRNKCSSCNYLCAWFVKKNEYLINEMVALNRYLDIRPENENIFRTSLSIKLHVIDDKTDLPTEAYDIIREVLEV